MEASGQILLKTYMLSVCRFLADLINNSPSLQTFALLDKSFAALRLKIGKLGLTFTY